MAQHIDLFQQSQRSNESGTMSDLDTNASFAHMWIIWRFVGIYPYQHSKRVYIFYALVTNLVASVISPLTVLANAFLVTDLPVITRSLQVGLTLIVSSLKQLIIFTKLSDLLRVESYLKRLDFRACRNTDEVKCLKIASKQCRLIAVTIEVSFVFSLLSYAISGLIQGRLVYEGWLPFDWASSRVLYAMGYGFQFFSTGFQIVQNAANDAYPPMYINMLTAHINALRLRVAKIGQKPAATSKENYIELMACINDHKDVISLFEAIRPVIAQTVLLQFLISAFVLCLTIVTFTLINQDLAMLINAIVYIAAVVFETFPVCYFASTLEADTDRLTSAIYSCNWMDQSIKFQKCLIIFMQRSHTENKILAGGLVNISLPTFVSIIRFSFSIFAIFAQMH